MLLYVFMRLFRKQGGKNNVSAFDLFCDQSYGKDSGSYGPGVTLPF
jgi:hypothetical protein